MLSKLLVPPDPARSLHIVYLEVLSVWQCQFVRPLHFTKKMKIIIDKGKSHLDSGSGMKKVIGSGRVPLFWMEIQLQ